MDAGARRFTADHLVAPLLHVDFFSLNACGPPAWRAPARLHKP